MNQVFSEDVAFISPHFDDIVFSCGGTVLQLAQHAKPAVVTVFSQCGLDSAERLGEEESAADFCQFRPYNLGLPDLVTRQPGSHWPWRMYRGLNPGDFALVDEGIQKLETFVSENKIKNAVFPLGVGGHVDHQLCFEMALGLARKVQVYFFEDLPYGFLAGCLEERLGMLTHEELKNHPGNAENLGLRADYYLNRPPFLRWNRPGSRQIIKILIKNYFRYGHPNPYSEKHKEKLRLLPRSVNIDEVFEKKLQASALYKGQFEKIFGKLENASANFKKFHQKSAPDPRLSEFFWELLDR